VSFDGPLQPEDQPGSDQSDDSDEAGDEKSNVNVSLGIINSGPVQLDQPLDEPVTSGGSGIGTDSGVVGPE
jgi:hypothetical protein